MMSEVMAQVNAVHRLVSGLEIPHCRLVGNAAVHRLVGGLENHL